jgi:hypothetical protein
MLRRKRQIDLSFVRSRFSRSAAVRPPFWEHLKIRLTSNRSMAVTKELWIRSRRHPKTALLWD